MTLLSRVLGLVRDIGMAQLFGLGPVMDAFTVAFRIPNLARRLFGEGAVSVSFLPIFARELEHPDRTSAWRLASAVFTLLSLFLAALVLLAEAGLWGLSAFGDLGAENDLLVSLTALMLPYLVLVCLAAQVAGVLNSLGHFTWPAFAPVLLNVCWIIGIWGLAPLFTAQETQARLLAVCIVIAGGLQLAVQGPALRSYGYRFTIGWKEVRPQVIAVLRGMLPVVVALSITQINTFADSLIAWGFSAPEGVEGTRMPLPGAPYYPLRSGAVATLYYGERMYQFPLGVFGVALGTVLFPLLARHAARGETERLRTDLSLGLRLVIAIGVPASAALVWFAEPIARVLFQRGAFQPEDTLRTARVIAVYGSAVWSYCGVLILQRAFYALGDRVTPLRTGLLAVGFNFCVNLLLIWPLAEAGLALGTVGSSLLQLICLTWGLQHLVGALDWSHLVRTLMRTLSATGVMLVAARAGEHLLGVLPVDLASPDRLLLLLTCSAVGFLAAARLFGIEEFWLLLRRERPPEP